MADVFISYSRKDHAWAENLSQLLEKSEVRCWMAPRNLTNAYRYEEQIFNAIAESSLLLFLVSRNSVKSKGCQGEVAFAYNLKKVIIPVYLERLELPGNLLFYLSNVQSILLYHDYGTGQDWVKTAVLDYLGKDEKKEHRSEIAQENMNPVAEDATDQQQDMPRVFISHDSDDAYRVGKYVKLLEDNGIPCWIAPRDIPYGSNYAREIPIAVENCICLIVFVSEQSQSSEEIEKEIQLAINYNKTIIPARLDNSKFTGPYMYHLTHKQWFEAYRNQKEDIDKLISDINLIRNGGSCSSKTSTTENNTNDVSKQSSFFYDMLYTICEFLQMIWDFFEMILFAGARLLISVVGIIGIVLLFYILISGDEVVIQIKEIIGAFIPK